MKRSLSILLTFAMLLTNVIPCWSQSPIPETAPSSPSKKFSDCETQGLQDSSAKAGTGGAFTIGLVSGFALGLIGTGIAWASQGEPKPAPAAIDALENAECRTAYRDAYQKSGRARKRRAALLGGLVGTGVVVAVIVSAAGSSD